LLVFSLAQRSRCCFSTKFYLFWIFSSPLWGQTTLELDEFNAAYFQYSEMKDVQPEVAKEAARRAYELGRSLFGAESERSAMLAINYATMLESEVDARVYLDEAVTTYQAVFGFGSKQMIQPLSRLGRALVDQGRLDLSEEYFNRALELSLEHLGDDSGQAAGIKLELGALNMRTGALDKAWSHLNEAKEVLVTGVDQGSRSGLSRARLLIGEYHLARGNFRNAIEPLLLSLKEFSRYPSAGITVRNHIALIKAYEYLDDSDQATLHCLAIGSTRRLEENENLRPVFTPSLNDVNLEHAVRVNFTVNVEGHVIEPRLITKVESESLEIALMDAIKEFRFAPRFIEGDFVESPNQHYDFR